MYCKSLTGVPAKPVLWGVLVEMLCAKRSTPSCISTLHKEEYGGDTGTRTLDPLLAKQVL